MIRALYNYISGLGPELSSPLIPTLGILPRPQFLLNLLQLPEKHVWSTRQIQRGGRALACTAEVKTLTHHWTIGQPRGLHLRRSRNCGPLDSDEGHACLLIVGQTATNTDAMPWHSRSGPFPKKYNHGLTLTLRMKAGMWRHPSRNGSS